MENNRKQLKQLTALAGRIESNEPLSCAGDVAGQIAERVGKYVQSVQEEVTPNRDSIPVDQMNEFEREEDRQLKAEWARLRPVKAKLTSRKYLTEVLTGGEQATPATLRQLGEVLIRLLKADRDRLERAQGPAQNVRQLRQNRISALANEPDRLMLLQRYANAIDRSIRRNVAQLR